jgi:hypothetical protein
VTLAKNGVDIDYFLREKPLIQFWDEPKVIKREKVKFGTVLFNVTYTLFTTRKQQFKIVSLTKILEPQIKQLCVLFVSSSYKIEIKLLLITAIMNTCQVSC